MVVLHLPLHPSPALKGVGAAILGSASMLALIAGSNVVARREKSLRKCSSSTVLFLPNPQVS